MKKNKNDETKKKSNNEGDKPECFVIMPIGNQVGYDEGHFKHVYNDIFKKAIEDAGFKPYRADDSKSSSVIHIDIIKKLIDAPMAICDLSAKNPNVMYELGIRQAFDKPVVLVGDSNPGDIFDIGNINTYQYRKSLIYREVLEDQKAIRKMLEKTFSLGEDGTSCNSLISLIKINAATINTSVGIDEKDMIKMIYNELVSVKSDINKLKKEKSNDEIYKPEMEEYRVNYKNKIEENNIVQIYKSEFIRLKRNNELENFEKEIKLKELKRKCLRVSQILNGSVGIDLRILIKDIDMYIKQLSFEPVL